MTVDLAHLAPGTELPPHRVTARNLAADSENRIHADDVARRHGFEGGLVAGITTYAYLSRPVVEALGEPWLERGTFGVRLLHPLYDGEPFRVDARVEDEDGERGRHLVVEGRNGDERVCAVGTAGLPDVAPVPPQTDRWPEAPLPAASERPPATPEVMRGLGALGSVTRTFRAARAAEFLDAVDDDLALYRDGGPAHPGWVIYDANQVLALNVALGPWIHTGTDVTHFSTVRDGDVVSTRGRIERVYERKGHHMVDADLLVVADGGRPVWHLRHTAIFRIAPAARSPEPC